MSYNEAIKAGITKSNQFFAARSRIRARESVIAITREARGAIPTLARSASSRRGLGAAGAARRASVAWQASDPYTCFAFSRSSRVCAWSSSTRIHSPWPTFVSSLASSISWFLAGITIESESSTTRRARVCAIARRTSVRSQRSKGSRKSEKEKRREVRRRAGQLPVRVYRRNAIALGHCEFRARNNKLPRPVALIFVEPVKSNSARPSSSEIVNDYKFYKEAIPRFIFRKMF